MEFLCNKNDKKAAKRLYFLVQLKRAKVSPEEPVHFYVACVQSVLLYGCQVFHFSLPQYLSLQFEPTQKPCSEDIDNFFVAKCTTQMPCHVQALLR